MGRRVRRPPFLSGADRLSEIGIDVAECTQHALDVADGDSRAYARHLVKAGVPALQRDA